MKTVLVVDDSKIMRNIVKNIFSTLRIPCTFFEAESGKSALQQLKSNPIHIMFLDWHMPNMNGIEFLREIRLIPEYKNIPVMMVTSEASRYNVIDALKAGATDYMIKPINERIFKEKVLRTLIENTAWM
jgi:two-component system chemotaxis response regulator CheY